MDFATWMQQQTSGQTPNMNSWNVPVPSGVPDVATQFNGGWGDTIQRGLSDGMYSNYQMPSFLDTAKTKIGGLGSWASANKDLITGGLSAATGLMGAFNAWNSNKMAKEQFNFNKDAWATNHANQVKTTNAQLEGRAAARYAANPNAYEKPDSYMARYGVK